MKKIILLSSLLFINKLIIGQISTIDEAPKAIAAPPMYDSSFIDNEQNVKMYIGSKIYITPFNKKYKGKKGYKGFMKDTISLESYSTRSIDFKYTCKNIYKIDTTNNYHLAEWEKYNDHTCERQAYNFCSSESALSGKTFKVINASNLAIEVDYLDTHPFYFQLISEDTKDTLYFYYPIRGTPFYFIETYEKLKKTFKGKTLVKKYEREEKDISSGLKITMPANSKWKCKDVAFINPIDESNAPDDNRIVQQQLGLLLENELSQQVFLACEDNEDFKRIFEQYTFNDKLISEYNNWIQGQKNEKQKREQQKANLIQKYGTKYGSLISERKIEIGMTKEMCEKAWGKPAKIDKLTTANGITELWSYYFNSFLSFRDDKLIIIKE